MTRLMKLSLIPILLTGFSFLVAEQPPEPSAQLRNPKSGVSVTLPDGWEFQAMEKWFVALSKDRKATVRLASVRVPFDVATGRAKETVGETGIDVSSVDETTVNPGDETGGLEGLATVSGRAINDKGQAVDYLAYILKLGDTVEVALGAWLNESDEGTVREILDSLKVELPAGEGGLVLRDDKTGASIQLPDSWRAFATPFGLAALDLHHEGMVMILHSEDAFATLRGNTRTFLKKKVFRDITIDHSVDLGASDAGYPKGFAESETMDFFILMQKSCCPLCN